MAKKRKTRTRTRTVTRVVRRGLISNSLIAGAIGGAIASVIPDDALWGFGDALGVTAVGYLMRNKTLEVLGAFMLGSKLIPVMGGLFSGKKSGTSPSGFL